jgi:hypothetical protein
MVVAYERAASMRLGADVLARFDAMHGELEAAYQQHRLTREALLSSTRATSAAAAAAMASVDELIQVARIAFDGQPEVLKQFRKKSLPFSKKAKVAAPPGPAAANDDAAAKAEERVA